jgi:hypothetical protein
MKGNIEMINSVAIDSNLLTYLLQAMVPGYNPLRDTTGLVQDKITMMRLFLYSRKPFYISPKVQDEYMDITDSNLKEAHKRLNDLHLLDMLPIPDKELVKKRKDCYLKFHPGEKDCQILAEVEIAGIEILLTRDRDFYDKLHKEILTVKLMKPIEFWNSLKIPKGTPPITAPHFLKSITSIFIEQ